MPVGAFEEMVIGTPESRVEARARLQTSPRWPLIWWIVLGLTLPLGALVLGYGAAHLREAHLYRQSSGEGLMFGGIMIAYLCAHGFLGATGYAIVRLKADTRRPRIARALHWLSRAIVGGLLFADAVAIWVEWHGDRCIGACG